MGTYTKFFIKAELISRLPAEVEDILFFIFGDDPNETDENYHERMRLPYPKKLPNHEFFIEDEWKDKVLCGRKMSYFNKSQRLLIHFAEFKNYHNQIEQFISWITPYVAKSGSFWYEWVEDWDNPRIKDFEGNTLKERIQPTDF